MAKDAWKRLERKVAYVLNGKRSIEKGGGGVDVHHERFAIECKYRKQIPFKKFFDQACRYAADAKKKKQDKIPILIMKEAGQTGEMVILKLSDFAKLVGIEKRLEEAENNQDIDND